jgi:monoamine oxidase
MAYSMLDEGQRIAQALQDLAKIHPEAAETFEYGISHDWALDRHGGGIGPLFRPLEMTTRFYDDVVRPVGRVWFSSDACDKLNRRWIEGAIASAVTTASAINAGMRNQLPKVAFPDH